MTLGITVVLMLLPLLLSTTFAAPRRVLSANQQFQFSLKAILSNAQRPDVKPGMVVASPSREAPNYYYDWVRDTALTMRSLIDLYELNHDQGLRGPILRWVDAEAQRQNQPALTGLGEPKFNVDGTAFTGPWGRPQNDGPALRALAMIKLARLLLAEGQGTYVAQKLYRPVLPADSIIKRDLEYVAYHWAEPSFDLWEEEKGQHFYTLLTQHVALQEGAKLARALSDEGAAAFYQESSDRIGQYILSHFMSPTIGIVVTTGKVASHLKWKDSGLDVAPLLALLHTSPWQKLLPLDHPQVKLYIRTLVSRSREIYQVNRAYPDLGVSIGRYPEDTYNGYATDGTGNPWFLSTLALGEYYCLAGKPKTLSGPQLRRVLFHSDQGHLSEQFNRDTGYMQGAVDLTWSHNAVLTYMVRCGLKPL